MATGILKIGLSQKVPLMQWKPFWLDPAPSLPVSLSAQIRGQATLCDGHSSDCQASALSSSLDSAHPVCLMIPSGVLARCWRVGFVFALVAGWDSACSGAGAWVRCASRWCMCWEIPRLSKMLLKHHHFTVGTLTCFWCKFCFLPTPPLVHPEVSFQGKLIFLQCWSRGGL